MNHLDQALRQRYRLAALQHVKGLKGQKYVIESKTLGETTDLGPMLKARAERGG
jgi:hypothetical protein